MFGLLALRRSDRTIQFEVDNVIGTVGSPTVLHTNSMVRRDIPLTTGWNWISFNLLHPDPSLNAALASLQHPENDLFKNQTTFSEYAGGWLGSLAAINNTGMFQYRADVPDTIQMRGALIDPAALNIPVSAGWNWVGYVPNYALPVSVALGGLTPLNGDIIKGQTEFAQYIAGFGWLGSLQFLEPPKGYQLKISNPGTITYPANFTDNPAQARGETAPTALLHWSVDPTKFEHTMTVVSMLAAGGQNATLERHEIGVFAGNELRGSAQAIYIEPLDAYLFFFTVYANTLGEQLQFKLFDAAGNTVSDLAETLFFTANQHSGSVLAPVPFTLQTTGVAEVPAEIFLSVRPNPFTDATTVLFGCEHAQEARISVTDMMGRVVLQQKMDAVPGLNTFRWNAGSVSAGVYFVRVETAEGIAAKKW
ncbi:MAG: T9SS type A sorting domain-containing protein [Lewinellaceae bacterium]|nr:T9SS type A sorting domain-containing protein [Lewinellaceae bacterium]